MSRATDLCERVLALVGDRAEAEVVTFHGNLSLTRFANSFIHQNVAEEGDTVNLRVAIDGRIASAATTATTPAALESFVDGTLKTAALQPTDVDWPGVGQPAGVPDVEHVDGATYDAPPSARAGLVKAFVDAGKGLVAAGFCQTEGQTVAFANTAGRAVERRQSSAVIDGIHQTGTSSGSGHAASAAIRDLDGHAVGSIAAQRAINGAMPFDLKPGTYEVVLAPEAVGTIAIFLGFYGFNGKLLSEGQSFAELGGHQFDERFSMWDDVTDPRALGIPFDTEGTPKRRLDLVSAGMTEAVAHNRRTARKMGTTSTGHHHPGADALGPIPTNLFIAGGSSTVDDLIANVERGVYVSTFNYCRVLDPKTLVVTGLTRNGTFMIENGRITGAVTNLRFTQSFVEALGDGRVLGAGDDARFADSEFGPGFTFVPTMHLASWNFTGGAGG
jgi:predicted Zn-dependent protease